MSYRIFCQWEKSYFLRVKIRYFLRVKISFYNTASFIYFVCSKNLHFFGECFWNKQNITWMLGNMKFISRAEQDISLVRFAHSWDILFNTRNKFHISAQPCNILYLILHILLSYFLFVWSSLVSFFYLSIHQRACCNPKSSLMSPRRTKHRVRGYWITPT